MVVRLSLFTALFLALSGPVYAAGVLYTPPLSNLDGTNQQLLCRVLNVTPKAHTVDIEILDRFGVAVASGTRGPIAQGATDSVGTQNTNARTCRITVTDGPKSAVKATLCIERLTPATGCIAVTVAP
jgi:hypothetical protein